MKKIKFVGFKKIKVIGPKYKLVFNNSHSVRTKKGTIRNISNYFKHLKNGIKPLDKSKKQLALVRLIDCYDYSYSKAFFKRNIPTIIDSTLLDCEDFNLWLKNITPSLNKYGVNIKYITDDLHLLYTSNVVLVDEMNKQEVKPKHKAKIYNFSDYSRLKNS